MLLSLVLYGLACWGIRNLPGFRNLSAGPLFIAYLVLALLAFYPIMQMSDFGPGGLVIVAPVAAALMTAMVGHQEDPAE